MACSEEGRLPDGTPFLEAFRLLREADAAIIGANCLNGPHAMLRLFKRIPAEGLLSAYPNAGLSEIPRGPLSLLHLARIFREGGARTRGGRARG